MVDNTPRSMSWWFGCSSEEWGAWPSTFSGKSRSMTVRARPWTGTWWSSNQSRVDRTSRPYGIRACGSKVKPWAVSGEGSARPSTCRQKARAQRMQTTTNTRTTDARDQGVNLKFRCTSLAIRLTENGEEGPRTHSGRSRKEGVARWKGSFHSNVFEKLSLNCFLTTSSGRLWGRELRGIDAGSSARSRRQEGLRSGGQSKLGFAAACSPRPTCNKIFKNSRKQIT